MSGSDVEPVDPEEAVEQMRDATDRLRDQGWMVAPITSAVMIPAETVTAEETSAP